MRAVVCTAYGPPDVLRLMDVRKPVPRDDEVLVRIRATTVSAADCELRRFDFAPWIWVPMRLAFGIRRPRRRVLGQELAGDVETVGKVVTSLRAGDRVFASWTANVPKLPPAPLTRTLCPLWTFAFRRNCEASPAP